jgi:non-heme chloroperoxidase
MATFTTDDGVRLHYLDEGSGTPIVLVAGFRAPATSWRYQTRALLEKGFRVLSLDRRSHGESEDPVEGHTLDRHGADLGNFLDALDLNDVALVGGSMGASASWAYLGRSGGARLRAIVSVDQTPKMLNEGDWPNGFYGYAPENRDTYFAAGIPRTGHAPKRDLRTVRRMMKAIDVSVWEMLTQRRISPNLLSLLHDHAVADWRDTIASSGVPVLMVAAKNSDYWPSAHATAMAERNPLVSTAVLDSGHAVNIEAPDAFNRTLIEFLSED